MRLILNLVVMAVISAALGLGLTALAVRHPPGLDAIRSGPWMAIASEGTVQVDAYALAAISHRGEIPLPVSDGLSFRATTDDEGAPLRGACTYSVSGQLPAVRAWSIAAFDPDGAPFANPANRHAFTSGEITRAADGAVAIQVSSVLQPGNWLPVAPGADLVLILRLYDTTAGALAGGRDSPELLSIRRVGCRA